MHLVGLDPVTEVFAGELLAQGWHPAKGTELGSVVGDSPEAFELGT